MCLCCASRTNAEFSAAENACSRISGDSSAGQLSRVLHPRHALPDGRDPGGVWVLRVGRDEFLRPGLCWGSQQVSRELNTSKDKYLKLVWTPEWTLMVQTPFIEAIITEPVEASQWNVVCCGNQVFGWVDDVRLSDRQRVATGHQTLRQPTEQSNLPATQSNGSRA